MTDLLVELPARVGIDSVDGLYETMQELAASAGQSGKVAIHCQKIERIEFCGLQLLVAFVQMLNQSNLQVCWEGVNEVLEKAVDDTNLGSSLCLVQT